MSRKENRQNLPSHRGQSTPSVGSILHVLNRFGINASTAAAERIAGYVALLLEWNEKVNLTSIREPLHIVERHFAESLFGAKVAGIDSGNLLDIGSGAGFPAVPIALLSEGVIEVLVEPNLKKATFLAEVCRTLGLEERVSVVRTRLEDLTLTLKFDFITSRALRLTKPMLQQCAEHLKSEGKIILWKGGAEAITILNNSSFEWNRCIPVPGSLSRCIITGRIISVIVSRETNK